MSLAWAWETTADDVVNVFRNNGQTMDFDRADAIVEQLDHDEIGVAALYGHDMEEQTEYAYQEIERQLKEKKFI